MTGEAGPNADRGPTERLTVLDAARVLGISAEEVRGREMFVGGES